MCAKHLPSSIEGGTHAGHEESQANDQESESSQGANHRLETNSSSSNHKGNQAHGKEAASNQDEKAGYEAEVRRQNEIAAKRQAHI